MSCKWDVALRYNGRIEGANKVLTGTIDDLTELPDMLDKLQAQAVRTKGVSRVTGKMDINGAIFIKQFTVTPVEQE